MVREIAILIPVCNDWAAVQLLLPEIDAALRSISCHARVLLVDDGSTMAPPAEWTGDHRRIANIAILRLRRNLGHQRAIAIGLVHIHEEWRGIDALVVMDADGEDRPQDIPELLSRFCAEGGRKVVFAARSKRLEKRLFRFFYHAYRITHKLLTGISVRVGNFSVIPPEALDRLMVVSELWNHYAAAVFRSRIPCTSIPLPRGTRLAGRSQMNFVSLLVHGFGAISVFSDIVGARLLALTGSALVAVIAWSAGLAGVRMFTGFSIPAWTLYLTGILLIILAQALIVLLALVFIIISGRAGSSFVPIRDASLFIDHVEERAVVHA